ncbi:uncharacterized protein LOC122639595 [Telopea speciosissima]|uniref:uncharacterized protein LOC122639595 n=1 Tax=Telopea speciosissima TaxID=54955 RepID=UPI001CC80755|nr:uncharacterized protein LOC122639595 [Telopea speciosissima]XP_043688405.1 uncharacterized protein LOC122639595 [Telopea speciosissima]
MSTDVHSFVEWKEEFVSQERGNRIVYYFLKDAAGDSVLAVVGTERSLRHMVYVVAEDFLQAYGSEKSINVSFKWRSRREVVDWLTSMLMKHQTSHDDPKLPMFDSSQAIGSTEFLTTGLDAPGIRLPDRASRIARKLKGHNTDIVWSGVAWTCGKQLKHYPAFCRNGTTIAIHSFVLVMAEEENHYLAHLEDMYEDKKGQKKVKVRWFHHNQEVKGVVPLPNPHPREVFFTPYAQVISAECVDGPTTILTPEHYEKCLAALPESSSPRIHLCFRQFRSNRIKPFDLSKLRGYFHQIILSCIDPNPLAKHNLTCNSMIGEEEEKFSQGGPVRQGAKRTRSCRGRQKIVSNCSVARISGPGKQVAPCLPAHQNLKFRLSCRMTPAVKSVGPQAQLTTPFKVHEKIELLCQDSGIRGCWFRCTVLRESRKQLKVKYDDLQNEDGCGNLEEWIPAFRLAAPDKLGMRCSGRLRIRPRAPEYPVDIPFEIGAPVDAWWCDGWWEGVVTGINSTDGSLQVYFPGEDFFSTFQRRSLRSSKDWVGNRWVNIEVKPDILSIISAAVSPGTKLSSCSTMAKGSESGGSAISDREGPSACRLETVEEDNQEVAVSAGSDGMLENVEWVNYRKQPCVEDEAKRDDADDDYYDDDDGEYGHDDDDDDGDEDDDGHASEDRVGEEFDHTGQKCEAIELMEVAV